MILEKDQVYQLIKVKRQQYQAKALVNTPAGLPTLKNLAIECQFHCRFCSGTNGELLDVTLAIVILSAPFIPRFPTGHP